MTYDEIFKSCYGNNTICCDFDTYIEELSMDNIQSLSYFLDYLALVPDEAIIINDGTQAIIKHPKYDFLVRLDSSGRRDFYSHRIDISKYEE